MTFLSVNFLTISVLSLSKGLYLFAENLIHNLLMTLPHLILFLAVKFVPLSHCRKSWFANWYEILHTSPPPPPPLVPAKKKKKKKKQQQKSVLDLTPIALLKTYLDDLVPFICRIVNGSPLSGSVPLQFKEVVVGPTFWRRKKALMQTVWRKNQTIKNADPFRNCIFSSKTAKTAPNVSIRLCYISFTTICWSTTISVVTSRLLTVHVTVRRQPS